MIPKEFITDLQVPNSSCEILFHLEFKLDAKNPSHDVLRQINQNLVDSSLHFFINGFIHDRQVFSQDLQYNLQGKKIIKSAEKRIKEFQAHAIRRYLKIQKKHSKEHSFVKKLLNMNLSDEDISNLIQIGNLKPLRLENKITSLYTKMINLNKVFGVKIKYDKMRKLESFLTNFNKLVNCGGEIDKYVF